MPDAIEEILRWTSPVVNFLRTATEDFELAGTRIAAGDTVGLFYPSANRDERVFTDPYRFDITRSPNPHLTFGFGAHFCLGTNLARAELKASLRALLPYLDRLETSGVEGNAPADEAANHEEHGGGRDGADSVGPSPATRVCRIRRRQRSASKPVPRCRTQRLSQITVSPTHQR